MFERNGGLRILCSMSLAIIADIHELLNQLRKAAVVHLKHAKAKASVTSITNNKPFQVRVFTSFFRISEISSVGAVAEWPEFECCLWQQSSFSSASLPEVKIELDKQMPATRQVGQVDQRAVFPDSSSEEEPMLRLADIRIDVRHVSPFYIRKFARMQLLRSQCLF